MKDCLLEIGVVRFSVSDDLVIIYTSQPISKEQREIVQKHLGCKVEFKVSR